MEAIDIDAGEYVALFTNTGMVVTASTDTDWVVLTITDQSDEDGLRARIRDHQHRMAGPESTEDPQAFAGHQLRPDPGTSAGPSGHGGSTTD